MSARNPLSISPTVINPANASERYETRLWPDHCIQGTPGADLVPELEVGKVDKVVEKGQRKEVEMYSAFYDPLEKPRCSDSGVGGHLEGERGYGSVCCGIGRGLLC